MVVASPLQGFVADIVITCLHIASDCRYEHVTNNDPFKITFVTGGGLKVGAVLLLANIYTHIHVYIHINGSSERGDGIRPGAARRATSASVRLLRPQWGPTEAPAAAPGPPADAASQMQAKLLARQRIVEGDAVVDAALAKRAAVPSAPPAPASPAPAAAALAKRAAVTPAPPQAPPAGSV